MQPVCQLEEFALTKLHVDFQPPKRDEAQVSQASFAFDYAVATQEKQQHRYRLTFQVGCKEVTDTSEPVGASIEAEIVGYFTFDVSDSKEKMDKLIRLNGVSILYGILRGIVATTTGVFPGGKFVLPTVMPQDIVTRVENQKAKSNSSEPQATKRRHRTSKSQLHKSSKDNLPAHGKNES